jgi:alpha-tubulin suppressor-like RCC1 family protein
MALSLNIRRFAAAAAVCAAFALAPAAADAAGGSALGWGYNFSGQVGNGTTSTEPCYCVSSPAPLLGVTEAAEIVAGYEFGLALGADGTVKSWGYNHGSELGDGTTNLNPVPTPVPGLSNVAAVAAGSEFALALLGDGSIVAWGENAYGQLGLGDPEGPETCNAVTCSKVPRQIPGISNAIAIAASGYHSMALLADGTVLSWGADEQGQQADGVGMETGCFCVPTPHPIAAASGAVAIAAGYYTSAALFADGTVRDWGGNGRGDLGTGQASPPTGCQCLGPVSPAGLPAVARISSGGSGSIVLLQSGGALDWGLNYHGQVGNGAKSSSPPCYCVPLPTAVIGLTSPRQVMAGGEHVVALLADGTMAAWGDNQYGLLGNGSATGEATIATPVPGVSGASEAVAGEYNSYAILGPSHQLQVEFAGDGAGTVGGRGIVCPSVCAQRYPEAQVEALRAQPPAAFAGFSGPCTGTGACKVKMDGNQAVTATFGRPKGTTITKAKIVRRKKLAIFSFSAPGAITGYECMLVRPVTKKSHKGAGKSAKRRKPRFSACSSPRRYRHLKPGRYVFRVRALDILGADANPATRKFKLKALKKPRR